MHLIVLDDIPSKPLLFEIMPRNTSGDKLTNHLSEACYFSVSDVKHKNVN